MSAARLFEPDPGYYPDRAQGLLTSARDGTPGAVEVFERNGAPLTEAGGRLVVAREHGFADFDALLAAVAALPSSTDPFVLAFRAIQAHDVSAVDSMLTAHPELVHAVGTNGNDLLGLAAGSCDERTVAVLIEHGADVNRGNAHGWTPLHQAGYSGLPHLARMLLEAGADPARSARGDGGTPLVAALFWGHREVADQLAEHGVVPRNLRVAAGLDDVALVLELAGTPAAGAHRGFYRPHGGFPAWKPSEDPREVLDEALSWAARSGATRAVEALVGRGAAVDADVYRGTALAWAVWTGRLDVAARLVELGADVDRVGTFGGPGHGEGVTALHLAAQRNDVSAIEFLLAAGADPTVEDGNYTSTPAGWAEHFEHPQAAAALSRPGSGR